jgi:hypothetical protein
MVVRKSHKSTCPWRSLNLLREYEKHTFLCTYAAYSHRQGQKHKPKWDRRKCWGEGFLDSTSWVCGAVLKLQLSNFIAYFRMKISKQVLFLVNNDITISSWNGFPEFGSEIHHQSRGICAGQYHPSLILITCFKYILSAILNKSPLNPFWNKEEHKSNTLLKSRQKYSHTPPSQGFLWESVSNVCESST